MANYYVGSGGNDGNAGTSWGARKLTIQAAVNVATTAGDTIYVAPGTYRETVTMGTSGTAGHVISLIGDYTGSNTSGTRGVVRITGSTDDISTTRNNCIVASSKSYITISGFRLDLATQHVVYLTSCAYITVSKCSFLNAAANADCIRSDGASQSNITVTQCEFDEVNFAGPEACVYFTHSSVVDNAGHVVSLCIMRGRQGVRDDRVGGVTVKNCVIVGAAGSGVRVATALTVGQTLTVNNCIFSGCTVAMQATTTAEFVENYNTIYGSGTARTNVNVGANSVARPPLWDKQWFFEAVNGGTLIMPFDLASYSTLVELNSGTGAPSTDLRGASQVGSYREWGALEYNSGLSIAGGGGGPIVGSRIVRGIGVV
jgi:hypothetical protein